jgi:hypothetical protein
VDQEQVHPVHAEPVEARAQGVARLVVAVVVVEALRGHEDLVAREARGAHRGAHAGLVAVRGRGVDVAVSGLQRAGDHVGGLLGRHLEDPEAELGDVEGQGAHIPCVAGPAGDQT